MGRAPCCDKTKVKKGPWSPEEDTKLKSYIDKQGTGGNWIALPQKIGLKRCGKSCRLRWLNYLRPNIKHGGFSEEEDNIICSLYINIGSRWSIIAAQLPGRTDNDIKNYWNTRLKKKLLGKQRKEQQAQNRRAAASLKQEMKRSSTTTSFHHLPPESFVNQPNPYWAPELPVAAVLPVMSYQTHDTQVLHDHQQASIKNMLLKLGGRFSDTTNSMYPIDHISSTSSDQFYQTSTIDQMLSCSPPANRNYAQLGQSTTPTMFHGVDRQSNLEAELSELVYGNGHPHQQLDGLLAGFYQMENLNNGSIAGTSTSAESEISWGDINSLVYSTTTPIVSEYENNCQQGVRPPDSAFAESTYFGLK